MRNKFGLFSRFANPRCFQRTTSLPIPWCLQRMTLLPSPLRNNSQVSRGMQWFSGSQTYDFQFSRREVAKQVTLIDPAFSDHNGFIVGDTFVMNMMMQKKMRIDKKTGEVTYNHGFGYDVDESKKVETDLEYQARIRYQMSVICYIIKKYEHRLQKIALEEAAYKAEDIAIMADYFEKSLPAWKFAHFDMTDFSVASIIRTVDQSKFYTDETISYGKYNDRCQTFTRGPEYKYKWSNIHVAHSQKNECLSAIINAILDDMLQGDVTRHDVAGDFNMSPDKIEEIAKACWIKKCREFSEKNPNHQPYKIILSFSLSPKGHKDGKAGLIDTDGVLRIEMKPAERYSFTFETKKLGLFAALFGAGVMLLDSVVADESAAAAGTLVRQAKMRMSICCASIVKSH